VIENFTRAKIEVATVPTVADLRARQLDLTRASLRERILAGDFEHVRVVVESLAQEFDIVDIAAAAVKMAHSSVAGDGDDREIPVATAPRAAAAAHGQRTGGAARDRERPARRFSGGQSREVEAGGRTVRLFIGAGRQAGIRPGDLVGAITGEAGVESRTLGAIEIADKFSLIDVPEGLADEIIAALKATTIRGKKVSVRRERSS
jgi:ATP-dependent RNA helicase DeaD